VLLAFQLLLLLPLLLLPAMRYMPSHAAAARCSDPVELALPLHRLAA
jgi:hypothetical protein